LRLSCFSSFPPRPRVKLRKVISLRKGNQKPSHISTRSAYYFPGCSSPI